jgi:hypothetical protein
MKNKLATSKKINRIEKNIWLQDIKSSIYFNPSEADTITDFLYSFSVH